METHPRSTPPGIPQPAASTSATASKAAINETLEEEVDETTTTEEETNTLMAIAEGSGSSTGTIGIAVLDLHSQHLALMQFLDDKTYTKLSEILAFTSPKTVYIPHYPGNERKNFFIDQLSEETSVNSVDRNSFNETVGKEKIEMYSITDTAVLQVELKDKNFALAAAGALFTAALEANVICIQEKSLEVLVRGGGNTLMMDLATVRTLELLMNEKGEAVPSLYGFLNYTKTLQGRRFLRDAIINPLMNQEEIESRLKSIQLLLDDPILFETLNQFLKELQIDFNGTISRLVNTPRSETTTYIEGQVDCVVYLKHALQLLPMLSEALAKTPIPILSRSSATLDFPALAEMLGTIRNFISDDCVLYRGNLTYKNSKMFAVKAGDDSRLELTRKIYGEQIQDMINLAQHYSLLFSLPGNAQVKMVYSTTHGYQFEVPKAAFEVPDDSNCIPPHLPEYCWGVRVQGKGLRFTTADMQVLNSKVQGLKASIFKLSFVRINELVTYIRQNIAILHDLSSAITNLDFICALATAARIYDLTCPAFSDSTNIRGGVNPIFMKIASVKPEEAFRPVEANDTILSPSSRLVFVTGANMSGKSSYLRQVALLQVLAQMGSFVPAKAGSRFRIVDQIFTRIGSDDDIQTNCSTFMNEIRQLKYMMSRLTNNSLVLIDELGRGTSEEDAVGLCVAVVEYLLQQNSFVLFATHFTDLVRLQQIYPFISSYKMESKLIQKDDKATLTFTYKLLPLMSDEDIGNYGIDLADKIGMNPAIVSKARSLLPAASVFLKDIVVGASSLREMFLLSTHLKRVSLKYGVDPRLDKTRAPVYLEGVRAKFNEDISQLPPDAEERAKKYLSK